MTEIVASLGNTCDEVDGQAFDVNLRRIKLGSVIYSSLESSQVFPTSTANLSPTYYNHATVKLYVSCWIPHGLTNPMPFH